MRCTPSPGRIVAYQPPGGPGIRVDSHVYQGYSVPPNYDSLIGKIIAYGDTRQQAIARLSIALSENENTRANRQRCPLTDGGTIQSIEISVELCAWTRSAATPSFVA